MVSDIEHEQVYYFNQTYKGKNDNTINATKWSLYTVQLSNMCPLDDYWAQENYAELSVCLLSAWFNWLPEAVFLKGVPPSNLGIVLSMSKLPLHSGLASEQGIFCLQSSDRFCWVFLHFLIQSLLFAFRDRRRWCSVEFDQCILKDCLDVHHIWQTLLIFRGVLFHTTVTN